MVLSWSGRLGQKSGHWSGHGCGLVLARSGVSQDMVRKVVRTLQKGLSKSLRPKKAKKLLQNLEKNRKIWLRPKSWEGRCMVGYV